MLHLFGVHTAATQTTETSNIPTQNEALRIATGCQKMSSVDHLHIEAKMLKVREHSDLLSAQYLARCLEPGNVCHSISTRKTPKRWMKETLFARHRSTVEPMMLVNNRKETFQAIHSDAVNKAIKEKEYSVRWSSTPNQRLRKSLLGGHLHLCVVYVLFVAQGYVQVDT